MTHEDWEQLWLDTLKRADKGDFKPLVFDHQKIQMAILAREIHLLRKTVLVGVKDQLGVNQWTSKPQP